MPQDLCLKVCTSRASQTSEAHASILPQKHTLCSVLLPHCLERLLKHCAFIPKQLQTHDDIIIYLEITYRILILFIQPSYWASQTHPTITKKLYITI